MRELASASRPRIDPPKVTSEDREISKEAEKWIKDKRKVDTEDLRQYRDFLKNKDAGIFRILPNFDCVSKSVIRIDGACENFVPSTSDYSFQKRNYTEQAFHEIEFNNGYLVSDGFFSQGVLVSLGDLPIDSVTLDHAALKYLTKLRASKTSSEARDVANRLRHGSTSNGYLYADRLTAKINNTYALRVLAYTGGNAARNLSAATKLDGREAAREFTTAQRMFYQASNDDRKDIIVVFRVVRSSADQGLTIIWKQIRKMGAPDLKFAKDEVPGDFKSR